MGLFFIVAKTKVLISCAVTIQLTNFFVFAYAKMHVFLMKWFISSRNVEGKKNQEVPPLNVQ